MSVPETVAGFRRVAVPRAPWPVYRDGEGPPVLLLQELFGFTEPYLAFARRLVDAGFSVWLPVLAGPVPADTALKQGLAAVRVCVSREIHLFARGATSDVVKPLRELARHAVKVTGAHGAGVVGMCFSGGFALALAADEPVLAGVAAQPALPYAKTPFTRDRACDLGLSPRDEGRLVSRLAKDKTGVYVTRFSDDEVSPAARAREIERRLGVTVDELPTAAFRPGAHSVLTYDVTGLSAEAKQRLDETAARVVTFLRDRLSGAAGGSSGP